MTCKINRMNNLRKYRTNEKTRNLFSETKLLPDDFIHPLFVVEGQNIRSEIKSLAGVFHLSVDEILRDIGDLLKCGINKILLFPVPNENQKDTTGSKSCHPENLVSKAIESIKDAFPQVVIMTDVCLCGYTSHGHCGVLDGQKVDHNATIPLLAKMALEHARAGADFVSPSAMMDGQVNAIRSLLDKHNYYETKIMSYSAKYSSNFYGPFRDAVGSSPSFGDRKSHQMDYRNSLQAIEEMKTDIQEGADILMVKPAHTYLDIIRTAKNHFPALKLAGYHVSGEFMLIKAASQAGYLEEKEAFREVLTAIKRAGADLIISYYKPSIDFYKYEL